ncbi:putative protein OS=Streptomyces microflavus OX=1919 GN=Smic_69520 PE=4 SV=1 [Streptomyces microflavus]
MKMALPSAPTAEVTRESTNGRARKAVLRASTSASRSRNATREIPPTIDARNMPTLISRPAAIARNPEMASSARLTTDRIGRSSTMFAAATLAASPPVSACASASTIVSPMTAAVWRPVT